MSPNFILSVYFTSFYKIERCLVLYFKMILEFLEFILQK